MRDLITRRAGVLPAPDPILLADAALAPDDWHDRFAAQVPALTAVEHRPGPDESAPLPGRLRVAAWNAERLKYAAPSAALLRGADVVLLTEADIGMARSGNRHTVRDLAEALGMGWAYGVEFVELGLGDSRECEWHADEDNRIGLHGNAILSRHRLVDPVIIPLDAGGTWFAGRTGSQRRLGGRMALAARLDSPRPLWLVAAHLESHSDAADRGRQAERLVAAIDRLVPAGAGVVLGGDFNTTEAPGPLDATGAEPLFAVLRDAGFDWRRCNAPGPTQRTRPDGTPVPPFAKLDWLFTRNAEAEAPETIAAVDAEGQAISDHEVVAATVVVGGTVIGRLQAASTDA
ncbi:endonuclease/exonuclease/phosphatase family metal-dependent hydrolase [Inquilinus ginsengisoli]|uniref:Endonuclease/exonuclease/phosphatase family metal-dependent hydrolase n=1 Tax=Inquilinus ginsengisoli TaxID=363840 RepID=A0ABU1JP69_9PROT|nr:endonuclease/exonuclease/phosphatase family protein [Inquilinus ginsengisoli]MDR6290418.1 endonuclease/exonuclease/phosphatase family metal-dependent hydrolase [Inquilinus ginsengisoli]